MQSDSSTTSSGTDIEGAPRQQDYRREDTRWEAATPLRDWGILLLVMALHTAWMLVVFFLEPGIR